MKSDFSRLLFDRRKNYSAVLFQQGRVQLDADLNELQEIQRYLHRTESHDVIGWTGAPKYHAGFRIGVAPGNEDLTISSGRIYVSGHLCEAETSSAGVLRLGKKTVVLAGPPSGGKPFEEGDWAELRSGGAFSKTVRITSARKGMSNFEFGPELTPDDLAKAGDPSKLRIRRLDSYFRQPYFKEDRKPEDGKYLVYLDVWERHIIPIDDQDIREKALGGPDTTNRLRTVWQVRLEKVPDASGCGSFGETWRPAGDKPDGTLKVRISPVPTNTNPCVLSAQAGYRGLENQLYRVEIHKGGLLGTDPVEFKWSRDNGSVVTAIEEISGATLKVSGLGPDNVLGFCDDQWVEILDDRHDNRRLPGEVVQIKTADRATNTILLKTVPAPLDPGQTGVDPDRHPKLRRWDGGGAIKAEIPAANDGYIQLENDVEIGFSQGTYRTGDYWLIPARTAVGSEIGSIEWPKDAVGAPVPKGPHGIHHHYSPLAVVTVVRGKFQEPPESDCRKIFPPLIDIVGEKSSCECSHCCTILVGDGIESHGDFDDIEEALKHLPLEGGVLCLLSGVHKTNLVIEDRRNVGIKGCGLRTKVVPRENHPVDPVFTVRDSQEIVFADLCIASYEGTGIAVEETRQGLSAGIEISGNRILAYRNAVRVLHGSRVTVRNNQIRMLDRKGAGVAVFLSGEECLIERNDIALTRIRRSRPPEPAAPDRIKTFDPHDECADFKYLYKEKRRIVAYTDEMFEKFPSRAIAAAVSDAGSKALGGIQVGGGSMWIMIRENEIEGGAGNGITLGGAYKPARETEEPEPGGRSGKRVALSHGGGVLDGIVRAKEAAAARIGVRVTSEQTRESRNVVSERDGSFRIVNLPAGDYSIESMSPGVKATKTYKDPETQIEQIVVSKAEVDAERRNLRESAAFLRNIGIEGNRIFDMGLSGIGMAAQRTTPSGSVLRKNAAVAAQRSPVWDFLETYGNPIDQLAIGWNHIARCLKTSLDDDLRKTFAKKGLGGISLGICENVTIVENVIEGNGAAPIPSCGIFVAYGEHIEVSSNKIRDNGAVPKGFKGEPEPGVRGGIVLFIASSLFDFDTLGKEGALSSRGFFAARIHGNVVKQPVGRALTLGAMGPVSVQDNFFVSQLSGPKPLDKMGGTVFLVNLGGGKKVGMKPQGKIPVSFKGSAAPEQALLYPGGGTLFQNNQSSAGQASQSSVPHIVASLDDVGFENNQVSSLHAVQGPMINALVYSGTARVGSNRCQEPNQEVALSVLSATESMNVVSANQGDHCIIALGRDPAKVLSTNNLTNADTKVCALVQSLLQSLIKR